MICVASATTSGIQLHVTHGFLLVRIECFSMDRIDPLVNAALIKAALPSARLNTGQLKMGCSCLNVDSLGQGSEGKQPDQVI